MVGTAQKRDEVGVGAVQLRERMSADQWRMVQRLARLHEPPPQTLEAALTSELRAWMSEFDYTSVTQMKGSMSHRSYEDPTVFERANYMKTLTSYVPSW